MKAPLEALRKPRPGARFHLPQALAIGAELALPRAAAHHAVRVLRLDVGDLLTLFDGRGGEYRADIVRINRGEVVVRTTAFDPVERESPVATCLVQGISSGDRMDYTVRKAVELGIARIVPVFTERSVVRLSGERADRRREHWIALAAAACEQCGRNRLPEIAPSQSYVAWLAEIDPPADGSARLLLSPLAPARLATLPRPDGEVMLLAGPEGGLTDAEAGLAAARGFTGVTLGPRILRTETVAVAALAAIQTLWGDF